MFDVFPWQYLCKGTCSISIAKKEGAGAELNYDDVFDGGASLNELAKDDDQECFLLFDVFVKVLVAAVFL